MSSSSKPGLAPEIGAIPAANQPRHFDTCETRFFEQGDAAPSQPQMERFDDLDEPPPARKRMPSRQLLLGLAVGGACAAVLGCVVLWRGSGQVSAQPEVTAVAPPAVAPSFQPPSPQAEPEPAPAPGAVVVPAATAPAPLRPASATPIPGPAPAAPAPTEAESSLAPVAQGS